MPCRPNGEAVESYQQVLPRRLGMGRTSKSERLSRWASGYPPQLQSTSVGPTGVSYQAHDGHVPQKVILTGSGSRSSAGRPPYVSIPVVSLYSSLMLARALRNVVHPLPGLPMTSSISPPSKEPENPWRRVRESSGWPYARGFAIFVHDLSLDHTVGAAWICH